jgi:hypothetical protein
LLPDKESGITPSNIGYDAAFGSHGAFPKIEASQEIAISRCLNNQAAAETDQQVLVRRSCVSKTAFNPTTKGAGAMTTVLHPAETATVFPHDADADRLFSTNFDQHPFQFRHFLDTIDIFQMPALLKLAQRCMDERKHKSHFETGEPVVNGSFGNKPTNLTLVQALERIGEDKNWIILKRVHEVPEYRKALELFISELSELTGVDLRRRYRDPILTIFITSPNRVTPYHLDGEANFLAQILGKKSVFLYDANDPYILTTEEMERYWTGNLQAPRWHDELSEGHWRYDVAPGLGVFNPATFPHWVKNTDNVSVSVSINFKRVRNDSIGAYRANYYARKIGLRPTEPRQSPALDRLKHLTFGKLYEGAHSTRRTLRTRLGI